MSDIYVKQLAQLDTRLDNINAPFLIDFNIAWLGINSTWQGIAMQVTIILFSSAFFLKPWLKKICN